jgi:hypothetical protein
MSRDLREYARQTNLRLIIGGILTVIFVGEILIYIFYGLSAALSGLLCFLGGLFPLFLVWLFLFGLDKIVERANDR